MRIATMATGGIGGYLAVRLGQRGHDIACIARGPHLAAIRAAGLRLDTPTGTELFTPAIATDTPAEIGPVDAVIFGVKGGGLEAAAAACRPLIGPDTVVVPFLNGVEAADRLAAILPPQNVANGVAYVFTTITEPGVIGQTGRAGMHGRFVFGERDNRPTDRIAALRTAIRDAGPDAPDVDDIEAEVWTKFVLFSAMSGVTAGARCRIGDIRAHPDLLALFERVMEETEAVGRARGVALPSDVVARHMAFMEGAPADARASTSVDLEKGAPLETPWLNGAVVRLGAEAGVQTPANAAIAALLAPYVAGMSG
ncbi:2-dehydropantoate 2-reductase [Meridianimarinicoccus roseus]|uniref:2-dehydropantoate 2-reductase n=1 Tax=Meridianimarinicoccus roseus TaxID=2072018 RepID=A0A2V2LNW0_9RHOB|nr:2-dehydropantoate 2-reductase [Meridianimarinicoccus roseus]PWR04677.1 2-dehydropantoate 2-reductase [Meridianimarinicoccus roseus]